MDTSVRAGARVLDDPKNMLATVPLDRSPVLKLVATVLAPRAPGSELPPQDCLQIGQLLSGHASLVADEVRRLLDAGPGNSHLRPLTETVLTEARGRLSVPPRATLASVQNRARLVRALYERHDRLLSAQLG
ncbi:restriction endonuclease [Streptomyces acidicola]|uniref:restriction endonuclease n=1 Tax=Streptomyces acidicola TaxID=2596892 RepID=UPI0038129AF4